MPVRTTHQPVKQVSTDHPGGMPTGGATSPVRRLKLASYNIQAGIETSQYRHYLTHSWKHVLPDARRFDTLNRIASLMHGFDLVGLQEVDAGSLRSGFVDQTRYLAQQAHFGFWYHQTNRSLGKFAQHSNGFMSRYRPDRVTDYRLPGLPGRGVLMAQFGHGEDALHICVLHLSLGRRARLRQIHFISELIDGCPHVILMGDLNCGSRSRELNLLLEKTGLREPAHGLKTFPSWRPQRNIDHILVSNSLRIENVQVLPYPLSDHLPIVMEISLPGEFQLAA